ncbi:hypothetical protein SAV14893_081550 [Streptomyces avermitilis]|uniref:Uncharacterized protein n=1 Tax=Streptomyces avermitilis TaxID=33903 RepID=A0A4D4MGA8_STRAX|nr:hypothetical protein SAV14893_081550 [Streptomyces avermitilis]GDY70856.1 hypothetical protein SAV31267_003410 [Streptomyces avermitilis]
MWRSLAALLVRCRRHTSVRRLGCRGGRTWRSANVLSGCVSGRPEPPTDAERSRGQKQKEALAGVCAERDDLRPLTQ